MGIGVAELGIIVIVFGVISIAVFVWWLMMLIEALRIPSGRWTATGQSQILYVLAMIFLGIIGTILYVLIPRKQLT
ncbi:hypothetical protein [Nocardioides gilvus]|uniref:hypothetical protein n=1 Tax=Nocardioides gilvus TaxID=1735589 RepID=UPI000D748714|nr:hypothetical protein [Nocardioides gilvus]